MAAIDIFDGTAIGTVGSICAFARLVAGDRHSGAPPSALRDISEPQMRATHRKVGHPPSEKETMNGWKPNRRALGPLREKGYFPVE